MPLSSTPVDDWILANTASASGLLTQTQFEQQLWLAVNAPRGRKKYRAVQQLVVAYPSLSPQSIVATLVDEVANAPYP